METSQGTKGVADLLKQLMPETTLVYSKAGNVSDFRNKFKLYKSRLINDFHHANDAYLNIVVGNVYFVKFTKNPLNFIRNEYKKDKDKYEYHLTNMFNKNVERKGEVAWVADPGKYKDEEHETGTIVTVRKVMAKHTPLLTRLSFEGHGGIANETLYSKRDVKAEGYIPLKVTDEKLSDITKYGGFSSISTAYFFLVEHEEKGKRIRTLETVPVYLKEKFKDNVEALTSYCEDNLHLVNPIIKYPKIKLQSCVKINGFYMHISGKTNKQIYVRNAIGLCLNQKWNNYIHKLEKIEDKGWTEDIFTVEKNVALYDELFFKHCNGIYAKKTNSIGKVIRDGRERFQALTLTEQCKCLLQIINLSIIGLTSADLKVIGGAGKCGVMLISKNISSTIEFKLIHQSVTGIFEKEVDLLTL